MVSDLIRVMSQNKIARLQEEPIVSGETKIPFQLSPTGTSGQEINAGYFGEEYLAELLGNNAADIYDRMRRQESQIKMVLSAVKNPILSAKWFIEPVEDTEEEKKIADFVSFNLFKGMDMTWRQFLKEALSDVDFGHSIFEIIHKVVIDHPKFGSFNGLKKLAFRSQRTIEDWGIDREGNIDFIRQEVSGDMDSSAELPGQFLLVFTIDREGDNYEGISMLRPCFGPYKRKQAMLKLNIIGIEKYAVPTPIATFPEGKQGTVQYKAFTDVLKAFTSHQMAYITIPSSNEKDKGQWGVKLENGNVYDPSKIQVAIDAEDRNIVKAFLANFLELGGGSKSSGGSYALSFDQSDFFLGGVEYVSDDICETVQNRVIKDLVDLNFGPREEYPELKCEGIRDKAGEEFAKVLKLLSEAKVIIPDDKLEDNTRKRYDLPERDPDTSRKSEAAPVEPPEDEGSDHGPDPKKPEEEEKKTSEIIGAIQLAEKGAAHKQITRETENLKVIMEDGLSDMGNDLINRIMSKARKLSSNQILSATDGLKIRGTAAFKKSLQETLARISLDAAKQANREVPGTGIKLAEHDFKKLPSKQKKRVKNQAENLTDKQAGDLESAIFFKFGDSAESTDSMDLLEQDLREVNDEFRKRPVVTSGAGTSAASIINRSRDDFFSQPEVDEQIANFTFFNPDPVSPICKDLNGRTFSKKDSEALRFHPPLHHNCKSTLIANLSAAKRIPEEDPRGLKPSDPELEKFITLDDKHNGAGK